MEEVLNIAITDNQELPEETEEKLAYEIDWFFDEDFIVNLLEEFILERVQDNSKFTEEEKKKIKDNLEFYLD